MSRSPDSAIPLQPLVPPALLGFARLACGATAGAVTKTIIAPLERIKIIHQTQGMHLSAAAAAAATAAGRPVPPPAPYTGIFQSIKTILQREGLRSLWNGNGANVLRVIPNYGLRFSLNDKAREVVAALRGYTPSFGNPVILTKPELFLAGSMAGTVQITITYPAEVVFTRLTLNGSSIAATRYTGILDCIARTWAHEGVRAFYNGYSATLLSGVPYVALQMSCYEIFQRALAAGVASWEGRGDAAAAAAARAAVTDDAVIKAAEGTALPTAAPAPEDKVPTLIHTHANNATSAATAAAAAATAAADSDGRTGSGARAEQSARAAAAASASPMGATSVATKLIAGAAAGLVAQNLTFPGDVVRKRMQSDGMGGKPKVYRGLMHACVTIAKKEGFKAFFDGAKVNSWRCLPEGAIMFLVFDLMKQALRIDQYSPH